MDSSHVVSTLWAKAHTADIARAGAPECARLIAVGHARAPAAITNGIGGLWARHQPAGSDSSRRIGITRLARFRRLIRYFKENAPWARTRFPPNDNMVDRMTATHLEIIVGEAAYAEERETLLAVIDSSAKAEMHDTQNILWVTSRQNGKTTTLGLFAAALIALGIGGGEMLNIYSTNLDRAAQVVKGAKQFLYWLIANPAEGIAVQIVNDNITTLAVRSPERWVNEMKARPRDPDSCRGDAPAAAMLDEFGFMKLNMWYKFAMPLLGKKGRIFTLTTTPPPTGGPFALFIQSVIKKNECGDFYFRYINHSLICDDCKTADEATECIHHLNYIPPWKGVMSIYKTASVAPESERDTVLQELFGSGEDTDQSYFTARLVDNFITTPPQPHTSTPEALYIAIDPASHSSSKMGLMALVATGPVLTIVALASVSAKKCDVFEVSAQPVKSTSHP